MGLVTAMSACLLPARHATLLIGGWLLSVIPAFGADITTVPAESPAPLVANLEYREASFSFLNVGIELTTQDAAFPKEPTLASSSKSDLFRGTLQLSGAPKSTEAAMGFLWDRAGRKLYLDLNRNRDLTDDSEGVFTSPGSGPVQAYQEFSGVVFPRPDGLKFVVSLNFYQYGGGRGNLNCYAQLRSFWETKLNLAGQDWQVGLISTPQDSSDAGARYLLLRPWDRRELPFSIYGSSMETFSFPRKLFVKGQAYRTELKREGAVQQVHFLPEQTELGDVKFSGEHLQRVAMHGGPYLVMLDQPTGAVKVPAGTYSQASVWLKSGDTEAYSPQRSSSILVRTGQTSEVSLGGPLTNSVAVARRMNSLNLSYSLVGAAGMTYELSKQDRTKPPEFAIYQGDKKLASGKFEFG